MAYTIHIGDLQTECDLLCAHIYEYEVRCHAYAANCILDIDQGQEQDENKSMMWRSLKDISANLSTARASLQIAHGICNTLQDSAVASGVWE
jgi:hypothetical protein